MHGVHSTNRYIPYKMSQSIRFEEIFVRYEMVELVSRPLNQLKKIKVTWFFNRFRFSKFHKTASDLYVYINYLQRCALICDAWF